jgi:deazaflavin-dependent oxidoreductase (nitroreductase family)
MKLYRKLFQWLGHARWFAFLGRPVFARVDRVMFRLTGGRLVPTGSVSPVLLLTTIGRRSGRERTTPVMYVREAGGFLVSSEDFGNARRRSAWPLNLEANPEARVQVGSERFVCRARRLDEDEVASYWPRLIEAWPAHATYLERSGRRHTFLLQPKPSTAESVTAQDHRRVRDADVSVLQATLRRR